MDHSLVYSMFAMVALAWAHVASRCAHTWIHAGRNTLQHRIAAYFASWAVLPSMGGLLVIEVAVR